MALSSAHGPLAREIKLRVAHAPGMRGTFSPQSRVSDLACITARAWPLSDKKPWASGEIAVTYVPWVRGKRCWHAFPVHAQPAITYLVRRPLASAWKVMFTYIFLKNKQKQNKTKQNIKKNRQYFQMHVPQTKLCVLFQITTECVSKGRQLTMSQY